MTSPKSHRLSLWSVISHLGYGLNAMCTLSLLHIHVLKSQPPWCQVAGPSKRWNDWIMEVRSSQWPMLASSRKRPKGDHSLLPPCEVHTKGHIYEPEMGPDQTLSLNNTFILEFSGSEPMRNKFLLFISYPVYGIFNSPNILYKLEKETLWVYGSIKVF